MVPCWDDLVPFRDDPARIVARVDDCSRGSVTHMDPPPDDPDKQSAARIAALQKALKSIRIRTDECDSTSRRGAPLEQRGFAEHDLIDEITNTGQRIGEARDCNAEPVYRTDGVWRVLVTVAKSRYCLAIADVARAVGVRRQAAVTPEGRRELAAARIAEQAWLATLLNGLGDHELKATVHVVRVIRQRLERDARERDRHKRGRAR